MRRFCLSRSEDVSGVSGVGRVAEGCLFSTGKVALTWIVGTVHSMVWYESLECLLTIHGHGRRTVIEWLDFPGPS